MSEIMYIKRLASGYWHVRFGPWRFAQWKTGELCVPKDIFGAGGDEEQLAEEANEAVYCQSARCTCWDEPGDIDCPVHSL